MQGQIQGAHMIFRIAFTTISRGALAVSLSALAPLGIPAVLAQTPAADADTGLGDIVVTASRRVELAKDVPVAVSAIGGEKLETLNSSGLDIRFLAARTPSLQVESSFGRTFPRFYIRGLGNTDFDPNAAQPVSVVYDDVALESPMLKSFPVFDLASVEVLRGPQGTLFGRNTPAGVIKLSSVAPDQDRFTGYASASWATYNTVNAEAAVGGPIGGGWAFRLSGLLQRRDDWVENDSTTGLADDRLEGYRDLAGRFQLAYEGGGFKGTLNIHGRDLDGSPRVFRAGIFQVGSNRFVPGFDKDHVTLDGLTSQSLKQWGVGLRMEAQLSDLLTAYSTTGYEHASVQSTGDIDGGGCYPFSGCTFGGLGVGTFPSNTGGTTRPSEFSQEFRVATGDMNGVRLQAGTYFFSQHLDYNELSYDGGLINGYIIHDNRNENMGVFGSVEYKATDALTLRGGLRYSHDEKRDTISLNPVFADVTIASQLVAVTLPLTNRAKADNISWDASATYAITPDVNVYARIATGYQGPAIQDRVTFFSVPSVAKKQTTISYEGGVKGAFSDALRFDLTGYYYKTDDLQLTAVGGVGNSARLINVNEAVGYGLEAEVEARPIPQLSFTAGGSYNFTEIRDPSAFVAVCGSGLCTPTGRTFTSEGTTYSYLDGNDLPQAPRYVANATLRYGIPVGDHGEVFAFTDWAYRSSINYFLYSAAEFKGRSSLEGGLKIGYKSDRGYEIAAFARNITNQIRAISAIDFNNLTGMINEPRIIGGSIRASF